MADIIEILTCPNCQTPIKSSRTMSLDDSREASCKACAQKFTLGSARKQTEISKIAKSQSSLATIQTTVQETPASKGVATQVVVQHHTNHLGIAGFVTSILGLFSCGLLSPISFIVSLIGSFHAPRGMAITGIILSTLGVFPFILFSVPLFMTIITTPAMLEQQSSRRAEFQTGDVQKLSSITIANAEFQHKLNALDRLDNYINFDITNNSDEAISRIYCFIRVKEPGRTIANFEDEFNCEINGGLEPKETKSMSLKPNMFTDLGKAFAPDGSVCEIRVYGIDGAGGKKIAWAKDAIKSEMGISVK